MSLNDRIDCDSWPRDWDKHMNKVESRLQALVKARVEKLKDGKLRNNDLMGG